MEDKLKKIRRHRQNWIAILHQANVFGEYCLYCKEKHKTPFDQRRAHMFFVKKFGRKAESFVARYDYKSWLDEQIRIAKVNWLED